MVPLWARGDLRAEGAWHGALPRSRRKVWMCMDYISRTVSSSQLETLSPLHTNPSPQFLASTLLLSVSVSLIPPGTSREGVHTACLFMAGLLQ